MAGAVAWAMAVQWKTTIVIEMEGGISIEG
jgi:hypothetical protein